ncbi:MAG: conserved membrane protein of unknown function [Promethearchaeota archaeon]|nr:MAG: conserved membrane protein of unknown function [Candidatus Lokiarchaeota archaeon]
MLVSTSSLILIITYIIFTVINLYSVSFIFKNKQTYGTHFIAFLSALLPIFTGIITSFFFIISTSIYISELVNIFLWKISLMMYYFSLFYVVYIYSMAKDSRNLPVYSFFSYSILLGFLVGIIFITDSVWIEAQNELIVFDYSIPLKLVSFAYQTLFIVHLLSLSYDIKKMSEPQEFGNHIYIYTLMMIIPILFFLYTLIIPFSFLIFMFIIIFWSGLSIGIIYVILNPQSFLVLTSKIYYINIYHKSGVQLYSYEFEESKSEAGSSIWGNILIGINHILSEFIDKKDQIDVLQTKETEIIVNYDNEYGYALLVIANKKSAILEKIMEELIEEFREKYKDELDEISDINRMINVSDFEDTKRIIETHFKMFL